MASTRSSLALAVLGATSTARTSVLPGAPSEPLAAAWLDAPRRT